MLALVITRTIVVAILLSSSMADIADVLVDLYVDLTTTRVKTAISLTNHAYYRSKQINWQKDRGK